MHPDRCPECGQNTSPGGKQASQTLLSKAKENTTLVCVANNQTAYSRLLDVSRKVT
jgi:hypothetical protein